MNLDILENLHAQIFGNKEDITNIKATHMYSKYVTPQSLFVAINNDYIGEAILNGATVILTNQMQNINITQIIVSDIINFLKKYTSIIREKYKNSVIAVLGASGKTSIKFMLTQMLPGKILYTRRSYNMIISICLELLLLNNSYDYCIIEIGTSSIGEVSDISRIICPDICVYGSIGLEHVSAFKSLDNIIKEESSVSEYTRKAAIGPASMSKYFKNYITIEDSNYEKCKALCKLLNINNIKLENELYLPNHRGNFIIFNNKKIYDHSFNCNWMSFQYVIHLINSRKEICDFILGNIIELGNEQDNIFQQIGELVDSCIYINKLYMYNIDIKSKKATNFNFDSNFKDVIYIQGSRVNNLVNIVCSFLNDKYIDSLYKFI